MTFSPVNSESFPLILETIPGMMISPRLDFSLAPEASSPVCTDSGVSFPAENAVITLNPSVSITRSQIGILDFSTSESTVK